MDITKLGPYQIGPLLGQGGMGAVYQGVHLETGQVVAIKALAPQLAAAQGFRERFQAEIDSLKKLRHPGIVRLYGYGEEHHTLFYAMELVGGRSLGEELKAGRRFSWREVVDISIQVCRALKHAHDHGIVHRDIKPANILLNEQGTIKLADFGIARLFGATQMTMAGGVLGTADYMSPEQAEGKAVTHHCDQYSLGCVMYALLANRPPFRANTLPEMLQLHRFAESEPVRRYAADAPEQLETVISQLLRKNPQQRFPSTLVLARHLEAMRRALTPTAEATDHDANIPPAKDTSNPASSDSLIEAAVTRPNASSETSLPQETSAIAGPHDPSAKATIALDLTGDEVDHQAPVAIELTADQLPDEATDATPTTALPRPKAETDSPDFSGHFTEVSENPEERSVWQMPMATVTSAIALGALVVAMGAMVWWLSRPYDADALYTLLHPQETPPSMEHLRLHANRVEEFLTRFEADPRAVQVAQWARQLELERYERQLQSQARRSSDLGALSTVERLYLDALRLEETDPHQAAEILRNLLALFPAPTEEAAPQDSISFATVTACLALAERRLQALQARQSAQVSVDRPVLEGRLALAEARAAADPATAQAISQAIIDLYADQLWAADLVERARGILEQLANSSETR